MSKLKVGDIVESLTSDEKSAYRLYKIIGYMSHNAERFECRSLIFKKYYFSIDVNIASRVDYLRVRRDLMALEQFDKDLEELLKSD